jgi:hypothetical protein
MPGATADVIGASKDTSQVAQWQRRTISSLPSFEVKQDKMILEVWDNAIQDGDSISIKLNGQWVVTGMAVTEQVQKVAVQLQAGENVLVFMADNVGTIPPNTAAVRFVAGDVKVNAFVKTGLKENVEVRVRCRKD